MADTGLVSSVAAAVADGDAVSWPEVERLASRDERAIVHQLRNISALSASSLTPARDISATRLPRAMSLVLLAALLQAAAMPLAILTRGHAGPFFPIQTLLAGAFGIAALILRAGGRSDRRAQWLMAFYLLTAASFAHPILHASTLAWVRALRVLALDGFAPYALWRFAQVFPRTERFSWIDRAARVLAAASLGIGAALALNNILVASSGAAAATWLGRAAREDPSQWYWTPYYPLLLGAFAASAARAFRAGPAERGRAGVFALILLGGAFPLLAKGVLQNVAPASFAAWMETGIQTQAIDAIVLGSLLLIPPMTTYAVLARGALSVRLVLHRAARYLLAGASVLALAALPAAALARYAYVRRDQPLNAILTNGHGPVLGVWLVAAIALLASRRALRAYVDRRFLRTAVDRHEALAASLAAIREANTAATVASAVAREIEKVFGARAGVLQQTGAGAVPLDGALPPLPGSSALVAMMADSRDPLLVSDRSALFELLPSQDRAWIAASRTDVLLPLHGESGRMLACVATTAPASGLGWTRHDLATLATLGQAAALALDRQPAPRETDHAAESWAVECGGCGRVAASAAALTCGCGAPVRPSLLPAELHGRFAVTDRIGSGGMGVVYRGRDLALGRTVALKTLPAIAPGAAARMAGEARAMAAIIHPQLGLIFGAEMWHRTPVLVMEFLAGGTLADRLRKGPLPVDEAVALAASLCTAAGALHDAGVLHGDIKPSNVGFTENGVPKLIDFGLARLVSTDSSPAPSVDGDAADRSASAVGGTPLYLPPEAFTGARPSPAFDLWALALVLFEMLTGRHPFFPVKRSAVPDVRDVNPAVPGEVAALLLSALSADPAQRPPTAAAFARRLR